MGLSEYYSQQEPSSTSLALPFWQAHLPPPCHKDVRKDHGLQVCQIILLL